MFLFSSFLVTLFPSLQPAQLQSCRAFSRFVFFLLRMAAMASPLSLVVPASSQCWTGRFDRPGRPPDADGCDSCLCDGILVAVAAVVAVILVILVAFSFSFSCHLLFSSSRLVTNFHAVSSRFSYADQSLHASPSLPPPLLLIPALPHAAV